MTTDLAIMLTYSYISPVWEAPFCQIKSQNRSTLASTCLKYEYVKIIQCLLLFTWLKQRSIEIKDRQSTRTIKGQIWV
jgi:hypothetical protein